MEKYSDHIIKKLLKKGANPKIKNGKEKKPIYYCIQNDNFPMFLLLKNASDLSYEETKSALSEFNNKLEGLFA